MYVFVLFISKHFCQVCENYRKVSVYGMRASALSMCEMYTSAVSVFELCASAV